MKLGGYSNVDFVESNMRFGVFDEADCLRIEKTELYVRLSGRGFRSVDFILNQKGSNELFFVEAKATLPANKNITDFENEIYEISRKFMDSLQLIGGIWFGGHNSKVEAPRNRDSFFTYGKQIVFVLVVKNRIGKLPSIAEKIKQTLRREHKLLGFNVLVMNEALAVKTNLLVKEKI
jgi:hypothetical protein